MPGNNEINPAGGYGMPYGYQQLNNTPFPASPTADPTGMGQYAGSPLINQLAASSRPPCPGGNCGGGSSLADKQAQIQKSHEEEMQLHDLMRRLNIEKLSHVYGKKSSDNMVQVVQH